MFDIGKLINFVTTTKRPNIFSHFEVDNLSPRCHPCIGWVLGGNNAGNVRSVSVFVACIRVAVGKIVVINDAIADAV